MANDYRGHIKTKKKRGIENLKEFIKHHGEEVFYPVNAVFYDFDVNKSKVNIESKWKSLDEETLEALWNILGDFKYSYTGLDESCDGLYFSVKVKDGFITEVSKHFDHHQKYFFQQEYFKKKTKWDDEF